MYEFINICQMILYYTELILHLRINASIYTENVVRLKESFKQINQSEISDEEKRKKKLDLSLYMKSADRIKVFLRCKELFQMKNNSRQS